jgi:hypothetical protein
LLPCRWFIMQISLLIWLKRRRKYRIGLITTDSSMSEIHQRDPPPRLVLGSR